MCERKKDPVTGQEENILLYVLRWTLEAAKTNPSALIIIASLAGIGWLYHEQTLMIADQRALIVEQTKAFSAVATELREVNVRIQNLEHNK